MNTQTHVLIAAALLAKPGPENRARNTATIIGALVPDILIFAMFGWSKIVGAPEQDVWNIWYFTPPWQTWIDYSNSLVIFGALLLLAYLCRHRPAILSGVMAFLAVLALSAITHMIGDFPLHVDDPHAHFVPLSDWRFESPVSYWDPNHHGLIVLPMEALGGMALCLLLWRRFTSRWTRAALLFALVAYTLPLIYFGFFNAST